MFNRWARIGAATVVAKAARNLSTWTTVTALVAAGLVLTPGSALAAVSSSPPPTPQLGTSGTDGTVEVVRQIVQCGNIMYAVGRFTQVKNPSSATLITRNNAFAFSATAPHVITAFNPNVNGRVDTVVCGTDGSVLLGGTFSTAGGAANRNLAKVNATTGVSMPFSFHPGGRVTHMEVVKDRAGVTHLLVGGYFAGYLDSRDPVSGADDGYGTPVITGNYNDPDWSPAAHATRIYNMTVSPRPNNQDIPGGPAVLMTGVFNNVGGQAHEQIFRLNLTAGAATVSAWTPNELFQHCFTSQPFYAQDAAWSPDGTKIFTATTGYKPHSTQAGSTPRTGPCDAVIAYPATEEAFGSRTNGDPLAPGNHLWINYVNCDSLYSVAADATTVFTAGHQRYVSKLAGPSIGCDDNTGTNPDLVSQPGLAEFDPGTGNHQPGPSRGRGVGAEDLLRTSAGLWIASDNQANTNSCAGVFNRMGICFLPNA